ncbi:serine hydrolase [Pseudoroseomonas cervicalis]|uniref:serine hydrolase domain-containing protein n=1 Tax=Teichococcus cervicalis TaxID=204525 RepID=UPI002788D790|nr:serine hydrolase domain-containing protein [Pseudoroseomonas cervicalis]MDQ1081360.1 CubicO group peptidase (beta-lactamase class C family) [Pseudoroseomonas cervicalis]
MNLETTDPAALGLCPQRLRRVADWADRWADSGKLPGVSVLVARRGRIGLLHCAGQADRERGTAMAPDTMVRIYSMTKPLTSLAALMLYEEGRFQLDDPITRFLPEFRDMRVMAGGARGRIDTVPAQRDITIRELMTHTSGLTYGFMQANLVDAAYREQGVDFQTAEASLAEVVGRAARLPLIAQPGAAWNYSISTDVLGHLVAVVSGQEFGDFMRQRILAPLGMVDTDFHVPAEKLPRFAANYIPSAEGGLTLVDDPATGRFARPPAIASGGGGLVSTLGDYWRFCQLMLNKGVLDGTRLLGRKTVELMTSNHLRGDMAAMGQARWSESTAEGIGFGLGFSVTLDPARAQILGTPGEYAWGGAASTAFWIDPAEEMAVILFTQLTPSSTYPIRRELRVLTYQAVID